MFFFVVSFLFFAAPGSADGGATIGCLAAAGSSADSLAARVGSADEAAACRTGTWKSLILAKGSYNVM